MTASSRYTRAISSEVGDIERRLQVLQSGIEKLGTRASSNARDTADGLSEAEALPGDEGGSIKLISAQDINFR
jgi:hypothetical protein